MRKRVFAFPHEFVGNFNPFDEIKEILRVSIFSRPPSLIFLSVLLNVLRQFLVKVHLQSIMEKVTLSSKFSQISAPWQPHVAGELNGQLIKLVKLKGEFVWHHHDNEDEMFLVIKGQFRMELTDKTITLKEGEFIIVPRGVEHKPVADEECWVMLFEPASTLNTGNVENERTVRDLKRV